MGGSSTSGSATLALMLAGLLLISSALAVEARIGFGAELVGAAPVKQPTCDHLTGVKEGDTCDGFIQTLDLTPDFFFGINPNINCDKLFLGQWVCVQGRQ